MQIVWRANFLDSTGYSSAARGYAIALHKMGVNIKIDNVQFDYPRVILSEEHENIIRHCMNKPIENKYIFVHQSTPDAYIRHTNAVANVGLSAWETSGIHPIWVDKCNQMDGVWLPSTHNMRVFKDSGVKSKIDYVKHGVWINNTSTQKFTFSNEDMPSFKFLSVFQWSFRKGYDILLKSFWQEFSDKDNVCLIIKTYGMGIQKWESNMILNEISQLKVKYGFANKNTAPIYVYTNVLSTEEMEALYKICDCFVLPSRGEGVGLPYLESAISGIPVIATGWGGQIDFLSPDNSFPIKYDLVSPQNMYHVPWYDPSQKWAEPNNSHLSELIRYVYNNRLEAKKRADKAKHDVETFFTWEESAKDIYSAVYRLTGEKLI